MTDTPLTRQPGLAAIALAAAAAIGFLLAHPGRAAAQRADTPLPPIPDGLILLDAEELALGRERLAAGEPEAVAALAYLADRAEHHLTVEPQTIVHKPAPPPSGDVHDYTSLSPYWWPNPETPDGLPYIRRDGRVNPERYEYDMPPLSAMSRAVYQLALAYTFTGEERYARHAADHLRSFFLDPETRMNPNLQFGQFVPGVAERGRQYGIIETVRLRWVIDAVTLLSASEHWSEQETAQMKRWVSDYLDWLLTSEHGRNERAAENNHGSWYAQQVMLYALFADRPEDARAIPRTLPTRIDAQFEPDGSQPHELVRTRSLDYCSYNLRALVDCARLAEHWGMDLWSYEADDGASLRAGLEFLIPYHTGRAEWPHQQIREPERHFFAQTLRLAAIGFDDPRYERLIDRVPGGLGSLIWMELAVPGPETGSASGTGGSAAAR